MDPWASISEKKNSRLQDGYTRSTTGEHNHAMGAQKWGIMKGYHGLSISNHLHSMEFPVVGIHGI